MEREWDCKTLQGVVPEDFLFLSEFTLFCTPGFGFAPKASLWLCLYLCEIQAFYPRSEPQDLCPDFQQWNNIYGTRTSGINNLYISPLFFSSLHIPSSFQDPVNSSFQSFKHSAAALYTDKPQSFKKEKRSEGMGEETKRTPRYPAKHGLNSVKLLF